MDKQKSLISKLNINQYKGIIFDFDDTLYHLEIDWEQLKQSLEKELKINVRPLGQTIYDLRIKKNPLYTLALTIIEKIELTGYANGYPNKDLLKFLKGARNIKLAIYSMNTRKTIEKFLQSYKLSEKIDPVITQEIIHGAKPQANDILNIIELWKLDKTDVIYVGNSRDDKISGKLAGIATILISL